MKILLVTVLAIMLLGGCGGHGAGEMEPPLTTAPEMNGPLDGFRVAVDAGHGGIDQGCEGTLGQTEAQLNLAVAFALKAVLETKGAEVIMTRTDEGESFIRQGDLTCKQQDMAARLAVVEAGEAEILISIHMNRYSDSRVRGAQVFYDPGDEEGRGLALTLQRSLNDLPQQVKKRSAMEGNYFILRTPECPCALVECGFLSNPEEEALLVSGEYQAAMARAMGQAIEEYCLGVRK